MDDEDEDDDDQDVVDVADTSTDDSSSIGNGSTGEMNSTTRSVGSTYYKGSRVTGSLILQNSQKNAKLTNIKTKICFNMIFLPQIILDV